MNLSGLNGSKGIIAMDDKKLHGATGFPVWGLLTDNWQIDTFVNVYNLILSFQYGQGNLAL